MDELLVMDELLEVPWASPIRLPVAFIMGTGQPPQSGRARA
jgi:hypothetical protein